MSNRRTRLSALVTPALGIGVIRNFAALIYAHDLGHMMTDPSFASHDVYPAVRPILAHSLTIKQNELGAPTLMEHAQADDKPVAWLTFRYAFAFELADVGRERAEERTLMVELTKPQAFQTAATYALKYWLRTKLMLDTGEKPGVAPPPAAPQSRRRASRSNR